MNVQVERVIRTNPPLRVIDCTDRNTFFAPALRQPLSEVERQHRVLSEHPEFMQMLNFAPNVMLVLNKQRQIVFANPAAIDALGEMSRIIGQRPGEALYCVNSRKMSGGCGTSRNCRYCGATKAIMSSVTGSSGSEECQITRDRGGITESLDYRVNTHGLSVMDEEFIVFALTDISAEKRRDALERIFLHDVMNSAVSLRGFADLMATEELDQITRRDFTSRVSALAGRIIDEINAQRLLKIAEDGEYKPNLTRVRASAMLRKTTSGFMQIVKNNNIAIKILDYSQDVEFWTDATLLGRIIGNLIKNAIEASSAGDEVTVGYREVGGEICIFVNNPAYMPESVQMQIFNRSFSTKGQGHGLGTYSVKLLTERYLKGKVEFESERGDGTTFVIRYPRSE